VENTESQIEAWRRYVVGSRAVNGRDVDELEDHLRQQIADLTEAGLTPDEGFLVAVKRMGDLDVLSREFAREHSGRLWKQLVLAGDEGAAHAPNGWFEAFVFAAAAAVLLQVARVAAGFPDKQPTWLAQNLSLIVCAWRRPRFEQARPSRALHGQARRRARPHGARLRRHLRGRA